MQSGKFDTRRKGGVRVVAEFSDVTIQDVTRAVDAILEGGPVALRAELRVHRVASTDQTIKIPYCGGYEHFERQGPRIADGMPVVFRWTGRTRVAE
jgi:hypothetical protein